MTSILLWLQNLDVYLFRLINSDFTNRFLDVLMPVVTNKDNWLIPGFLLLLVVVWRGGTTGRILVLLLIPTLILSDQLAAGVIKPLVGRFRPCKTLDDLRLIVHCGGQYGFPSNHAANIAAAVFLLTAYFKPWRIPGLFVVLLVGYSRIYVGVHYPLDVVTGFILGIICALIILKLYNSFAAKKLPKRFHLPPIP